MSLNPSWYASVSGQLQFFFIQLFTNSVVTNSSNIFCPTYFRSKSRHNLDYVFMMLSCSGFAPLYVQVCAWLPLYHAFLCVSMAIYAYPCITMRIYLYLRVSMSIYVSLGVSMYAYLCMGARIGVCVCMT